MENNLQCLYEELSFKFNKLTLNNNIIELKLPANFIIQIIPSDEKFNVEITLFYSTTEISGSRTIIHKRNTIDTIYNFMDLAKKNYCDILYTKLLRDFPDDDYIITHIVDENKIQIKLPGNRKEILEIILNMENFTKSDFMRMGLIMDTIPIESTWICVTSYATIRETINFYIDGMRLIAQIELSI